MTIIRANGANVDVVQTGAGKELVLLHSLLTHRSAFDKVAPSLAKTRRILLVNLPGYGLSAPAGPNMEDYAHRIAGLFPALSLGRDTDVPGNGFGGFNALVPASCVFP